MAEEQYRWTALLFEQIQRNIHRCNPPYSWLTFDLYLLPVAVFLKTIQLEGLMLVKC